MPVALMLSACVWFAAELAARAYIGVTSDASRIHFDGVFFLVDLIVIVPSTIAVIHGLWDFRRRTRRVWAALLVIFGMAVLGSATRFYVGLDERVTDTVTDPQPDLAAARTHWILQDVRPRYFGSDGEINTFKPTLSDYWTRFLARLAYGELHPFQLFQRRGVVLLSVATFLAIGAGLFWPIRAQQ